MNRLEFTLKPEADGKHSNEMILMLDPTGFPGTLLHIDNFWNKDQQEIYDLLRDGKTIKVSLELVEVVS